VVVQVNGTEVLEDEVLEDEVLEDEVLEDTVAHGHPSQNRGKLFQRCFRLESFLKS
jgi:hypothetical protein